MEAVFVGLVVFVIAMAGIAYLAAQAFAIQRETARGNLLQLARAAAGLVDPELHESLTEPSQFGGPDYLRALEPLVEFHRGIPEVAYVYTLVERDGGLHFVLDTAAAADRLGFPRKMEASTLMEPYQSHSPEEDLAELEALRKAKSYVSKQPFADDYGTFFTALAPIKTKDGRMVAAVGVDLDLTIYVKRLGRIRLAAILATAFVFVAAGLVGILVFRARRRLGVQEAAGRRVEGEKLAVELRSLRLVRALGQIVYHYDVRADRIEWRGDCERILGYPEDRMPKGADDWKACIHPRDVPMLRAWTDEADQEDGAHIREYRFLHRDGHPVWVLDRALLTRDGEGSLMIVDGVLLDISAQKEIEADLISARDAAEAAGRTKTDFLAVMSHEIRTPMNGVIGCTNLLLETPINTEQREYLETIRKCGDSLLYLINDILDFSKMESNKLVLEERPFSLRKCVEEVLDLYGLMAAEKQIELLAEFHDDTLDWICGDEVRFRQILVNLVGNALKFTRSGEVVVGLRRKPWLPDGNALMLSVKDTGIGIPSDKQQGIFLPFSQADSSTTRRFGGTGLGLAICGRLATLMGGAITVYSEDGKGAEFVVLVPLMDLPERNRPREDGPLLNKSVLLVDDNAAFRAMMGHQLGSYGMRVALAGDVPDLREGWDPQNPPDMVLVDGGLAGEVREELGRLLATSAPDRRAIVVELAILSLARSGGEQIPGLTPQGSLAKPIRSDTLVALMKSLFSGTIPPSTPTSPAKEEPLATKYSLKILIVEDNPINRKVVTKMLNRLGYSPEAAENGRECLDRLSAEKFDIILMDIQMPEMDGYEATAALRRRGDTTWITALTADAMPEDPLRCQIAGMNDYLSKPIRSDTLRAALERCAIARKK